jgi:hypothetical protein
VWIEIEKEGHHNGKRLGRVVSVKSRYVLYIPVSMLKRMGLKKAYGVKMMRDLKEPHRIGLQFFEDRAPGLRILQPVNHGGARLSIRALINELDLDRGYYPVVDSNGAFMVVDFGRQVESNFKARG